MRLKSYRKPIITDIIILERKSTVWLIEMVRKLTGKNAQYAACAWMNARKMCLRLKQVRWSSLPPKLARCVQHAKAYALSRQ
jgi:hypothetical protein